jgi:hypothetical protein
MAQAYNNYLETQSAYLDFTAAETMNPEAILKHSKQNHTKILRAGEGIPALTDQTPWLEYYYACPPRFTQNLSAQQLRYCYSQYIR